MSFKARWKQSPSQIIGEVSAAYANRIALRTAPCALLSEKEDIRRECVDLTGADVRSQESTETEARFRTLKEKWYRETGMLSFIDEKVIHPAYQMIIGMGEAALPYIFEEMRSNRGDWFWALNAITRGVTPAPGAPTFRNAVLAWLKWGEEQGYIKHEWETQR